MNIFTRALLVSMCAFHFVDAQNLGALDTDFRITLSPVSTPVGIVAKIETTTLYPCAGYGIRSFVTWEGDTISIHVNGLVQPSPCIHSSDTATGTAFLGDPEPGNYVLRIAYRGETDLHKMALIPGLATIRAVRDHFSSIRGF